MAESGKEEKITDKPESNKDKDFKDPKLPEQGAKDAETGESKSTPPDPEETEEKDKAQEPEPPAREIVRGEDVVKALREAGHRI